MPYVGNIPAEKYASFAVQHFTTSATTGYTLDNAVTNENDIRLVINNVVQQPGGSYAYTAAGTVLTLSAATTSSDTMYCVFLGKAVQTVNPGAGSVGTSQLATDAVTNVKVADDAIGVAELSATGTASSSTFLRGDNSWQDPGGVALATSTDNQVVTVTGADAITGETNFIYNGTIAGLGATGASADLGSGLHVKVSDTGASATSNSDQLVLEKSGNSGLSILSSTSTSGLISFGDSGDNDIGQLEYNHSDNSMRFTVNASEGMRIDSAGHVTKPLQPAFFGHAISGSAQSITNGSLTTLSLENEAYDINSDFNTGTYTFTAPVTGKYQISGHFSTDLGSGTATQLNQIGMQLTSSNRNYRFFPGTGWTDNYDRVAAYGSVLMDMDANDTVVLEGYCARNSGTGASTSLVGSQYFSWMGGHLVC